MAQVTYQTVLDKCTHPDAFLTKKVCQALGIATPSRTCEYSRELSPEHEAISQQFSHSVGRQKKNLAKLLIQKSVSFYEALLTYERLRPDRFTNPIGEAAFQNALSKADSFTKVYAVCYATQMGTPHEETTFNKMIEIGTLADWLNFYEVVIPPTDYGYYWSHLRNIAIEQIARLIKEETEAQTE
jgi:hypothetical protein